MSRSLMTGITGLRAHQQKLDVVANNLANLNTVGFKSQSTRFSDLMYNNNPHSIGTGVQVAQVTRHFSQGPLQSTSESLDFAIQGEGFFTAKAENGEDLFTRAGSFALDGVGRLIDPATGNQVQRFGNLGEGSDDGIQFQEPGDSGIRLPLGSTIPGQVTANMSFSGNLPSSTRPPSSEVLRSFVPFQSAAGIADTTTLFNDLTINDVDYVAGDEVQISGTNPDGSPFSGTLAVDTATIGDLINELNSVMTGATASLRADGSLEVAADDAGDGFLSLVLSDVNGNTGLTNFSANAMVLETDGHDGDTLDLSMEVYDLRGDSHRFSLEFAKVSANSWNVTASMSEESGVLSDNSVFNLSFKEDGTYSFAGEDGIGDANIEVTFSGTTTPQTINLDFRELSHLASEYSALQNQDGFPPGNLVSVALSATGELTGFSSNGRSLPLAQLALASFQNTGALEAVGGNYFRESIESGNASLGAGLSGGRGQVSSGQLESSNVDIAQEFTQLIVAQRGFSANARTITVADEMLEEITNIIR